MRYALLADVHGNLHALEAVVSALQSERIDRFVLAGDLVGYGAFPNECIQLIEGLGAFCVAGNHDLIALDRLSDERCIPLARQSLSWSRGVLVEDSIRFLSALPLVQEAPGGVALAHGSLDDPQEYTNRPEQATRQLDHLAFEAPGAEFLVLGHTHHPWCYGRASGTMKLAKDAPMRLPSGQRYLLNPGSVGQSREFKNHARFAVLDIDERTVAFRSVVYDFAACRRALQQKGLPQRSCHLPPSPLRRGRRLFRSATNRLLAAPSRPDQSAPGRLGIYVDDVYRVAEDGGGMRISADRAFLLFACEVGAQFDGLVLFGRTVKETEPGDYILPPWVDLVELPFYPDLRSLRSVGRVGGSTVRSAWRGLSRVDSVWVFGPHPFGIALIIMALLRRKRVLLGVRSDMVEYYRARLPNRRWAPLMVPLTAMDRFYKLLARRLRTTVVGKEIADDYGNHATVLPMTVSLISESDLAKSTGDRDWSGVIDLLSVGRLEAEKNPLLLLEMMNLLEQRRPGKYRLTVVGRGQLLERMVARAVELGIAQLVSFREYMAFGDELLDLYRRSNLFVHVSLTEGVPQVLIESLAMGTAVVATAVGGVPSAVAGGKAGILVPAEDAVALADAVIELTDNDDRRERLVSTGLELSRHVTLEAQSRRVAAFLANR